MRAGPGRGGWVRVKGRRLTPPNIYRILLWQCYRHDQTGGPAIPHLSLRARPPHPVNDGWAACVQIVHSRRDVAQHVQPLAPGELTAGAHITLECALHEGCE